MMGSKSILIVNAIISAIHGFVLLFAARDILKLLKVEQSTFELELIVQFLGIVLISIAALNWTAKGQIVGGIYGRPILVTNWIHSLAGAVLLGKFILNGHVYILFNILFIIYIVFTFLFGKLMFGKLPKSGS